MSGRSESEPPPRRVLFVGLGSPHGDDQAGWLVADRLAAAAMSSHVVVRKAGSPVDILSWLEECDWLIVCDACRGLGEPGSVKTLTWPAEQLSEPSAASWSGTHDLPLTAVLSLADELGKLPAEVVVWAIEASSAPPVLASPPCRAVQTAVERLSDVATGTPAR